MHHRFGTPWDRWRLAGSGAARGRVGTRPCGNVIRPAIGQCRVVSQLWQIILPAKIDLVPFGNRP
jgi:hypothetical protein